MRVSIYSRVSTLGATQQAQTGEPDFSAERVPSVRGSSVC